MKLFFWFCVHMSCLAKKRTPSRQFFFRYLQILTILACTLWKDRSPRSLGRFCSYLARFQTLEGDIGFCSHFWSFLTWVSQISILRCLDLVKIDHLHTTIARSTDVAAQQDYMFLKRARRDLFKKHHFPGVQSNLGGMEGVPRSQNLTKLKICVKLKICSETQYQSKIATQSSSSSSLST